MTLHSITWIENPRITWFVAYAEALLGDHVIRVPTWVSYHEVLATGHEVHITLPEPRHLN